MRPPLEHLAHGRARHQRSGFFVGRELDRLVDLLEDRVHVGAGLDEPRL